MDNPVAMMDFNVHVEEEDMTSAAVMNGKVPCYYELDLTFYWNTARQEVFETCCS